MSTSTYATGPIMFINDINNFEINCNEREEQEKVLKSQLRNKNQINFSKLIALFTSPGPIPSKRTNWLVNQKLRDLREHCL